MFNNIHIVVKINMSISKMNCILRYCTQMFNNIHIMVKINMSISKVNCILH